jgi:type III restriction enzyme
MKFIFKQQKYQLDAVKSVTDVFSGQPFCRLSQYTRDLGHLSAKPNSGSQMSLFQGGVSDLLVSRADGDDYSLGFANNAIQLTDRRVLANIQSVEAKENLKIDDSLSKKMSPLDLDIEMETGTGKTYVYIRTMFELNKLYGFSKFIIMVPSIAIREGVKKSFEQTQDHFMDIYGKKARFFIYDSNNLAEIDSFAKSDSIQAMIINIQAFNTRGESGRKIYEELDSFQSRKPIDVIKKTRPILILDEPQKMGGEATQSSIGEFNPLFTINYSATHKEHHNLVYVLDALDAYNQKLVKKIQVKGINVKNVKGTDAYLYLDDIILMGSAKDPKARIGFYVNTKSGIKEETHLCCRGDSIYDLSNNLAVYKNNFIVDEINYRNNTVRLLNGIVLNAGEVQGDVSEDLIRRIQIRETIESHIEKEEENFSKGIKTLSLFFIDEVIKYRDYSKPDEKGVYAKIFEDEYEQAVFDKLNDLTDTNEPYKEYLKRFKPEEVHKGYFSIDKKGHAIDSKEDRKTGLSDDESAYDLILKNKERLLSFDEPTRFIFSHSALREGWDNPNIFQICTLRHTQSGIQKRQEVGRGLRICVDKDGNRQDSSALTDFFRVNKLTVIANEEYEDFVRGLQSEIQDVLYDRPSRANQNYFVGKSIIDATTGGESKISPDQATLIYRYLIKNDYVDEKDHITEAFRTAVANKTTAELPDELKPFEPSIIAVISNVYNPGSIEIENGKKPKVVENKLNSNFNKKEFQELWNYINHKYSYRVSFDSNELITNCIKSIKSDLRVSQVTYTLKKGEQKDEISKEEIESGTSFKEGANSAQTKKLNLASSTSAKYDLVHEISSRTRLTRKTIVDILKGVKETFAYYRVNPEEYISKVSDLINAQKAAVVVNHVTYNQLDEKFDNDIFNERHEDFDRQKAFASKKAIQDYVFIDGTAKDGESNEMKFAKNLEEQQDVKVYAKMPKGFFIPTPMGKYSPDWAIVYDDGGKKDIYFIAETKGSLDSLELRKVEDVKITCAEELYNKQGSLVHYGKVHTYDDFITEILKELKEMNQQQ